MTTLANLDKQGELTIGITFATDNFTFDIPEMNAVITAYNTANSTNYPTWDTPEDNFEKFCHFLDTFAIVQNLILGNDTFNIKQGTITPSNQVFGTRGSLASRTIAKIYPFSSSSDVLGDSDALG